MKNLNRQFTLSLILFFLFICSGMAQKAPFKFGKVSKAELEMKVYPTDTTATAAILFDYGYFNSDRFEFVRTLRVKIFKKEGTTWGNQVFPASNKAAIKGITFNLENGNVVESKLKSESIFEERVTQQYFRTRVAMPNVREGSVVDIEFRYEGLPSEWMFQQEVPVSWSELVLEPTQYATFRKIYFGFERITESSDTRWVAKNMPAFKKEPFISAAKNYIARFEIELLSVNFPGLYRDFSTSWDAVNRRLNESIFFGKAMEGCGFLNSIAKEIKKNQSSPYERMKAAFVVVKKSIKWNEKESAFASNENLNFTFYKKIGNSADINLILITLLKKLDIEVYPVVLSTRDNGFLSIASPSLDKLNYVVAYVYLDDKKYFLDATEQFLPIGLLPQRCINLQGRLVDENKSEWIDLISAKKNRDFAKFDLKLEAGNLLTGDLTKLNYEYSAFDLRKKYEKFNSKEEYLKDLESENKGLIVNECQINNLDSLDLPVIQTFKLKIKNMATTVGDQCYINPLLFDLLNSNPFKTEERKYPVDFVCPSDKTFLLKIELPAGAQITEIPKPLNMSLPDGSARVIYQVTQGENYIQLNYLFRINKANYMESEYSDLRAFFSELVKKQSEQIVIKLL